jgi:hypothetical protein
VKEVTELINLCERLKDNLRQTIEDHKGQRVGNNAAYKMRDVLTPLDADIILMEVPTDLIKETEATLKKYNL